MNETHAARMGVVVVIGDIHTGLEGCFPMAVDLRGSVGMSKRRYDG